MSSSKSSKHSKSRSECRGAREAVEQTEEEENTKHLKELVVWWKEAREELSSPGHKDEWGKTKSTLDHLIPKFCTMIPRRLRLLGIVQGMLLRFRPSITCQDCPHTSRRAPCSLPYAEMEVRFQRAAEEAEKAHAEALEQGKAEGFSTGRLAGRIEGLNEGHGVDLQSEEHKQEVLGHCLQGPRDFLKVPAFKLAVDIQSARFLNEGFDKYIAQVTKLNGFVDGFDQRHLDPSLDANL
ncbi:hypothetical protein Salat_2695300 [Sesamum alatum]|uniref:Uncharacterized protein n=1 Tax=Sesamum alatum TaxID=300844 RepID=A0AAE2CBA6_9LAMI|nr:hypothetical protein Salat_2695300 [Sesamum alatum]